MKKKDYLKTINEWAVARDFAYIPKDIINDLADRLVIAWNNSNEAPHNKIVLDAKSRAEFMPFRHSIKISPEDIEALKGIKSYFYNSEHGLAILAYKCLKRITDQTEPEMEVEPASFDESPKP